MDRPTPEEYQPPLKWWGHVWRVLGMAVISALVWVPLAHQQWTDHRMVFWAEMVLGPCAMSLVFLRRRWPVPIALVIACLSSVSGLAAGPGVLAAVSVATRRQWWQIALVGLVNLTAGQAFTTWEPTDVSNPYWLTLTVNAVFTVGMLGWGMYIGSRRELIWTLKHRAERAEAEQELRAAQSRVVERARIAREMHDVLAHRISQISLHAGALSFRGDLSADEMRASAAVIQQKAHEALIDLRGVLGVLRDDQTGELMNAPQPTYADLPVLVEGVRKSGLHVEYHDLLEAADEPVPDALGRTLYRIVQEGITNARKHAPDALLSIEVSGSPDEGIDILLRNPLGFGASRTPGAGLGLIGLSERVELRGGRLDHRCDGSMFVLHGWLPWAA